MEDNERLKEPLGDHPIETGNYEIATPEIDRMCDTVAGWIANRTPGAIIHGRPRLGKSRAIRYFTQYVNFQGYSAPILSVICREYRTPTESTFFEDMLKDVGHGIVSGNASTKRDRLNNFLLEKAELAKSNRVIIFIDEAQRLTKVQYDWLMDIYNQLDRNRVYLTAILVGQDELLQQRTVFLQTKRSQIVGRFMVHTLKFIGITKIEELLTCLESYDEHSEYPADSHCSFTHYYFPDAYPKGFRLQSYGTELFNLYQEIRREFGIKKALEIPMQYLTLAVEYCLKTYGFRGHNLSQLSKIQWREAIERSGYINAEMYNDLL